MPDIVNLLRQDIRAVSWRGDELFALPRITRRDGAYAMVTAWDLTSETADAAIRAEVDHFSATGKDFEWKAFSFDEPPDLLDRLHNAGFEIGKEEAVMIYDLEHGLGPFDIPVAFDVRRIESEADLADFRSVSEAVFNRDFAFTTNHLRETMRDEGIRHEGYVAYLDGRPVSVGRLFSNPASKFAGLYTGGTLPEFRGRGAYRAVLAARGRAAFDHGARFLMVDAMPTSRPILSRLGFTQVASTWPCIFGQGKGSDVAV